MGLITEVPALCVQAAVGRLCSVFLGLVGILLFPACSWVCCHQLTTVSVFIVLKQYCGNLNL